MSVAGLGRIRNAMAVGNYDLTVHALNELAEDDLDVGDIESATTNGSIVRVATDDPRGSRYTLAGPSSDGLTRVGVVVRFKSTGVFLIITVFAVSEKEG